MVAYADDITLFVTSPNDLPIIMDIIQTFERAIGAQLNRQKSKAIAIAGRRTNDTRIGIDYVPQIKILGVTFTSTIVMDGRGGREFGSLTTYINVQHKYIFCKLIS